MDATNGDLNLAELVAQMRALGITSLKTSAYEIVLGAAPPTPQTQKQDSELTEVLRDERKWNTFWAKATRSSGAAIPPFPRQPPAVERNR